MCGGVDACACGEEVVTCMCVGGGGRSMSICTCVRVWASCRHVSVCIVLCMCLSLFFSLGLSICLSVCLSVCL